MMCRGTSAQEIRQSVPFLHVVQEPAQVVGWQKTCNNFLRVGFISTPTAHVNDKLNTTKQHHRIHMTPHWSFENVNNIVDRHVAHDMHVATQTMAARERYWLR